MVPFPVGWKIKTLLSQVEEVGSSTVSAVYFPK